MLQVPVSTTQLNGDASRQEIKGGLAVALALIGYLIWSLSTPCFESSCGT